MKFENSVMISRPVDIIFDFVTNFENNPQWQTDILELEITSEGGIKLGSTYRCVNRFMVQRIETVGVIVNYEPDRACSFRIESGSLTGKINYWFEADHGGTKFTTTADLDLRYFRFGNLIVIRKINKQLKNDMLRLKKLLENGDRRLQVATGFVSDSAVI